MVRYDFCCFSYENDNIWGIIVDDQLVLNVRTIDSLINNIVIYESFSVVIAIHLEKWSCTGTIRVSITRKYTPFWYFCRCTVFCLWWSQEAIYGLNCSSNDTSQLDSLVLIALPSFNTFEPWYVHFHCCWSIRFIFSVIIYLFIIILFIFQFP
jgi:hypothetical protein